MFCTRCGIKLIDGARFCQACGAPVVMISVPASPVNPQPVPPPAAFSVPPLSNLSRAGISRRIPARATQLSADAAALSLLSPHAAPDRLSPLFSGVLFSQNAAYGLRPCSP